MGIEVKLSAVWGSTPPVNSADTILVCAITGDPEYARSAAMVQVE